MIREITKSEKAVILGYDIIAGRIKRLSLLAILFMFSLLTINSAAQVCCPDFMLKDAIEICPPEGQCQGGTAPAGGHSMAACKLTDHTYTVFPNTAPYTYTWTITGGTPASVPSGNPVTITWGSGSTGFIKVVISGGGCLDSITQQICLIDGPQASFTAVPNPVCAGGLVHFTNTSTGGGAYLWDFGDGTTSTLASPPDHSYAVAGNYTVTLTATDMGTPKQGTDIRTPCGCVSTFTKVVQVLPGTGPSIETTCCYGTVCPGDTSSFCTPVVCGTYNWTVANGVIIAGAGTNCIKVKWDAVYTVPPAVSLAVPGCGAAPCPGTTTLNVPVLYPNLPISGPNPLCVGSAGSFFITSMPGTYYTWTTTAPAFSYTFNDKDRNVANVNMTFNVPGSYQIICNYNNPLAGCSGSSVFNINVLPVFSISGDDKACQYSVGTYYGSGSATWTVTGPAAVIPSPVTGNPSTFAWSVPGTYTITATPPPGIYCNLNAVKVVQVVAVPILNPISGPTLVCPNTNITYTVSSNLAGNPFTWSVLPAGTGTVQTQFGPDRSSAIVKLNGLGPWTISVIQQIEISPGIFCTSLPQTLLVFKYGPPVINPVGPLNVCVDATTSFTATGPLPIQWTVTPPNRGSILSGQGTNSVLIRWHGPPTVAIVNASHCGGSATVSVNILNPPVTPVITASGGPLVYCLPAVPPITFALSVPAIYASYQWYGPGGLIPGAINAAYAPGPFPAIPGSYVYTVVVSNGICTASANVQILIGNCNGGTGPPPNPINCAIDFTISPNPVCENQPTTFTATQVLPNTTDPGFNYQWAFGDGSTSFTSPTQHTYLAAGLYNVTLTATLGTCVTTKVHQVLVRPTPNCVITASDTMYCPGNFVTLTTVPVVPAYASYQWYKNGAPIALANSSSYNVYSYGDYYVEVSNSFGCTNISNSIFIYEKAIPVARITGEGLVCTTSGGTESFQLSSFYDPNYSYSWSSNPPGATFSPNNSNASYFTTATITLPVVLPYTCAFIVKVTDTVTGCENRDTLCITFYETPQLGFTFYGGCEGIPVTLSPAYPPANPGLYQYQWSNGMTTPTITVSRAGNYSLTITNKISGCSATALAAMIHPLPDLSLFPRGCDSICDTDTLHLYIPLPLNALPPFNTYASAYPLIKWIDNGVWASPIGYGQYLNFNTLVPGNHQISVVVGTVYGCTDTAGVFCLNVRNCPQSGPLDFGDAPDNTAGGFNYQTLLPGGARHTIVAGVYLGAKIDPEANGQPSIGANCDDTDCAGPSGGDDEDGVNMPAVVEIGNTYSINVVASVAGFLDLWIDYAVDGNWSGAGEHIFTSLPIGLTNTLSFTVPATATVGQSYARFRFRTTNPAISFSGLVNDGEVEDYPVYIDECSEGTDMDFGDVPDMPAVGYNYPTLLASNGARHVKYLNIRMGALIDAETNGQPNTPALGDDMAVSDDEDGVQFIGKMYVGLPANIQVTASVNGFLNAWMDFNKDGDWADGGEQIFTNQPLSPGVNNLTFMIPANAQQGKTYSRFRFNTIGGLTYFGLALNGEVEDYLVHACPYWWPVHTNYKHYITIPHDLHNMYPGDVVGVFYHDQTGALACGGLSEFNGTDDQMMVVYGDNPATNVKDGFAVGEPIIWKLCSVVKGDANVIDVTYDFTYPSSNGLFALNGLSALTDVNGLHVTASAAPGAICTGDAVQLHADVGSAEGVAFTWTSIPAGFNSDLQNPVGYPSGNITYHVDAFDGVFHAYGSVQVTVTQVNPLVEMLPLNNITIPSGQTNCFNATMNITTGGDGSSFIVERGGTVQLIAGQKIRMLPNTRIISGSYLHAGITTTGAYCCNTTLSPAQASMNTELTGIQPDGEKQSFKVYPNPTTSTFTLELQGVDESSKISVEIYSILGEKILKREMSGLQQQVFDLSGRQHGIYLIRVMNGKGEMGMTKIIKQ
ncbi:MAG: GEVED domain-containing protein [Bacteroidetes bacterium]|nr:GEVED domain-containing protein [Bacteroidota bacterium]